MDLKDEMRATQTTFTTFSDSNLAYYPSHQDVKPKFLFSSFEVLLILKKLKNKTSTGLDNIPTILIKNLPEYIIKDYTVIFNNAINNIYYPTR